jgi:hypothetical protein
MHAKQISTRAIRHGRMAKANVAAEPAFFSVGNRKTLDGALFRVYTEMHKIPANEHDCKGVIGV